MPDNTSETLKQVLDDYADELAPSTYEGLERRLKALLNPMIPHPLMHDKPYPASAVLSDLAGQEACDGEPYDTMENVATAIRKALA